MSTSVATKNQHAARTALRTTMAAVHIAFTWFGVRKSLTAEQKAQAADIFGAEGQFVSAGKKLLDTCHPAYKGVTGVRNRILSYWKGISLPYPEPGIRLIRQDDLGAFDVQLSTLKAELSVAVTQLDEHYAALKDAARDQLGRLYNPSDYPSTLEGMFAVAWDFPSVEPPEYLRHLSPDLYRQESERIAARFNEAVQLAEQAFFDELAKLVTHLTTASAVQRMESPKFFGTRPLTTCMSSSNGFATLTSAPAKSSTIWWSKHSGSCAASSRRRRNNQELRQRVATQLSAVQSLIDGLMIDRPRRNILRRAK